MFGNPSHIIRVIPKPDWRVRYSGRDQEGIDFFRYSGQLNMPWGLVHSGPHHPAWGAGRIRFGAGKEVAYYWVPLGCLVGFLRSGPRESLEICDEAEFLERFDIKDGNWKPFACLRDQDLARPR